MRVVETRRGARLLNGKHVLSEVLRAPGPTHSVFDVLAACVATLSPDAPVSMLGFAAGGMIAPLRAMKCEAPIRAVDLSRDGEEVFRRICGEWVGDVTLDQEDALAWLQAREARERCVVEDLSIDVYGDVTKPRVSLGPLPKLIAAKLAKDGVSITNVLPIPGVPLARTIAEIASHSADFRVIRFDVYVNRILVGGRGLPPASQLSRALRTKLRAIGSRLADGVHVSASA